MRDGDGCDLFVKLKESYPRMKGVALSGHGFPQHIDRCRSAGFHEFLLKPVELPMMLATISRVLENHSLNPE